jgi:hypothetical protein
MASERKNKGTFEDDWHGCQEQTKFGIVKLEKQRNKKFYRY